MNMDFTPNEWELLHEKCFFTDQEIEIVRLRRRGWRLADIATELFISERTLNRRNKKIYKKIMAVICR